MPRAPQRRQETQLRRRGAKCRHSANGRWIQLSSEEVDLQSTIQVALSTITTIIMAMTQLLALVLAAEGMANELDFDHDVINAAIDS